ncbi:MAG: DNA translocase FtsK [Bryobacteraceae bacterium]
MPEPVRLSVSEIRREIRSASGFASGDGQASTALLGTIFHQVFSSLMDARSKLAWTAVLDPETLSDHDRLREHAYENIVGPRLRENQAALQASTQQVLDMWEATRHLCQYITTLLTNSHQEKVLAYEPASHSWSGAEKLSVEEELNWLVENSSWSAPVLVTGIADGVWRNPASKRWCAVEMKLGTGAEAADVAQLCLYHQMLRVKANGNPGMISLLRFKPELKHDKYSDEQIEAVKPQLLALIGKLAGVTREGYARPASPAHRELGARLVRVLEQFGPMVALESDPVVGPTFLRFHIIPKPGVKLNRILPLGEDLAVQLRLSQPAMIRFEDGTLVVDLQRPDREKLLFQGFRDQLPQDHKDNAKVLVGMDLNRRLHLADLSSDCPHILAAGTTNSGKSEWLRTALASLIATNTPKSLRIVVIDPKRVTFGKIQESPFLLYPHALLFTPDEAVLGFNSLVQAMEDRYQLFAAHNCADLEALKRKAPELKLPRIVLFCDEYGNLVAHKKDRDAIEMSIVQLGAKARAAGIHLVVATQDPRAQILTPSLKNNLDARVCLRTASSTQSRMMLEQNGAESLLGRGDLLFRRAGQIVRLQALLLSEAEGTELFGG